MNENSDIKNNQNKEKNDISFEVKETVDIVPAEKKNNNNTPIIIIIAIVLIAIISSAIFFFVKKDDNKSSQEDEITTSSSASIDYESLENAFNSESFTNEEGQSVSSEEYKDYVQNIVSEATTILNSTVSAPHSIVEKTTSANEEKTELAYNKEKCEILIKAFLDRSCYLEGALNDSNGTTPVAVAFDGDNFEMMTSLEGTEISVVKIDGKIYFKRTALKQYAQLTDAVMQSFGLSVDMLAFDFGDNNYDSMKNQLTSITPVTIDGKEGVCFRYDKNDGYFKFYFVNDELVQLDIGNETEMISQFIISHFSSAVPGDMLSFKGYKEAGFMSLFADYM